MPIFTPPAGWGLGPWGTGGWSLPDTTPGGPLPSDAFGDIYCVDGPEMMSLLTHPSVTYVGGATQAFVDTTTAMFVLASGGAYPTTTARLSYSTVVPDSYTFEAVVYLDSLPLNFANLQEAHCFLGVSDAQGACAGLFISKTGFVYTGAVHFSGDDVVLDNPSQALPGSALLVSVGEFYTLRIAVSYDTGTTYIFWTKTDDVPIIGHQLRYILPAIPSSSALVAPTDRTQISVRGTAPAATILGLEATCLATGLQIPNLPPRADAGNDQTARACSVVQLDGTRSFDPEGVPVTYSWRIVDAPITSEYCFNGDDALTYPLPVPTGFTNKVYSAELAAAHALDPFVPNDVLLLAGKPHTIQALSTDGNGFFAYLADYNIVDSYATSQPFKVIRQRGLSGPLTAKPTFFPDVTGIYRFDLTVFDGGLYSTSSNTIVNVVESPVPRGVLPDMKFLWGYLSDFWRLVEGTEMVEVFWAALAQVAATELLTLWQHEYSKSLRDVQRTFQRRWLHYDLFVQDPLIEATTVSYIFSGVQSVNVPKATGQSIAGETINVLLPGGVVQEIYLTDPTVANPADKVEAVRQVLLRRLRELDSRFTVDVLTSQDTLTVRYVVRAPFYFVFTGGTTTLFTTPSSNDLPRGTGGVPAGSNVYRVGTSLEGAGVQEGDYLVVDGTAYRIARVITGSVDAWGSQRVVLSDPISLSAGSTWAIARGTTSSYLDFYDSLCSAGDVAVYEVIDKTNGALTYLAADVLSAADDGATTLLTEQGPFAPYLADANYAVYLHSVYRRTYMPVDPLVAEVPLLQEKIKNTDDTEVLRQNIDFFHTTFRGKPCLKFMTGTPDVWQGGLPPKRMWAEVTYIDNRPVIEQNFGIPAEFTLDDLEAVDENIDYLSVVRGLWYAYFNGPTVKNLRVGTQILLGLPFAEEAGTIVAIDEAFSARQGRILVQDKNDQAIVRSYTYPHGLGIETNPDTGKVYAVGDAVTQFAPLVEGTSVLDYVKDPNWIREHVNQGSLFEVEKYFRFLVRVDSAAFNLSALLLASRFVKRIKPTHTYPIFLVATTLSSTEVSVSETALYKGILNLQASINGIAQPQAWDMPRPSGGGYWNQYDQSNPDVAPTPYTPTQPVHWGFDDYLLTPAEAWLFTLKTYFTYSHTPTADSIFYADMPIFTTGAGAFTGMVRDIKPAPGVQIDLTRTSAMTGTINKIVVLARAYASGSPSTTYTLVVKKNGISAQTFPITIPSSAYDVEYRFNLDAAIAVLNTDTLEVWLEAPGSEEFTFWHHFTAILGNGQDWFADTPLPAGWYFAWNAPGVQPPAVSFNITTEAGSHLTTELGDPLVTEQ